MAVILLSELQALWIYWVDSQIETFELYNKLRGVSGKYDLKRTTF
jgi:hypothetical protein